MLLDWNKIDKFAEPGESETIHNAISVIEKDLLQLNTKYVGHYVLVVDVDKEYVYILNPHDKEGWVTDNRLRKISHPNFEVARKAAGTDQDLLFIFKS